MIKREIENCNDIEKLNDFFESCTEVEFFRMDKAAINEIGFSACKEVE